MLRKEVIEEEARFRQVYIRFYVAKVNQLSLRFCQGEPKVKDRWKGVGVTSEQLRKEKEEQGLNATKNFITLENLKVDRQEEAYLNLPYKFREFQPLNSTDFEIECEARDTKRRWELINRTPPDENMPDLGGGVGAGQNAERHEEEEQARLEEKNAGEIHDREGNILKQAWQKTQLSIGNIYHTCCEGFMFHLQQGEVNTDDEAKLTQQGLRQHYTHPRMCWSSTR